MLKLSKKREEKEVGEFNGVLLFLKELLCVLLGVAVVGLGATGIFLLIKPLAQQERFDALFMFIVMFICFFPLFVSLFVFAPGIITYSERKRLYKQLVYLPISEEEINKYNIKTAGHYLYEIKHYVCSSKSTVLLGKTYTFPVLIDLYDYPSILDDVINVMESTYNQNYSFLRKRLFLNKMFELCDSAESFNSILNDCTKVNDTFNGLNETLVKLILKV